jgi:drug/metabolite transporter (DMT)-like permease
MALTRDDATTTDRPRGTNTRGILAMLFGMGCFVTSDTLVKLIGTQLPISQIMFVRGVFATLFIGVLVAWSGVWVQVRLVLTPVMAWRTIGELGATIFFFAGLMRLPFADAAAIGQFTPLAVTAGAALFLNEPVGWRRWMATAVGLVGVLLIIRPGTSAFNWAALLIIACIGFVTLRDLITRTIGDVVPSLLIILVTSVCVTLTGMVGYALETWVDLTPNTLLGLAVSALGVTGGYYGVITAMRSGEIAVVGPFRYAAMLFALTWGYFIFGEVPDGLTWAGTAILVSAGLYTLHRERVRKQKDFAVVKL